jgi:hypothetical protein
MIFETPANKLNTVREQGGRQGIARMARIFTPVKAKAQCPGSIDKPTGCKSSHDISGFGSVIA